MDGSLIIRHLSKSLNMSNGDKINKQKNVNLDGLLSTEQKKTSTLSTLQKFKNPISIYLKVI